MGTYDACPGCGGPKRDLAETCTHCCKKRGRPSSAVCGADGMYYRHIRKHIPFPEDTGGEPCGCRAAHAAETSRQYKARTTRRRAERAAARAQSRTCPGCAGPKTMTAARCRHCRKGHPNGTRSEHGTETRYQYEINHGEVPCYPCLEAHRLWNAAHPVSRTRTPDRRHPCTDCGQPCCHSARRCMACSTRRNGARRHDRTLNAVPRWVQRGGIWRAAA